MPVQSSLAIIIPVYNAAPFIGQTLNKLVKISEQDSEIEIILVDDGSTDDTLKIIKAQGRGVRLIALPENHGKGFAVKTGMLATNARVRLFTDADLPFGTEILNRFFYEIEFRHYDIVVGIRNDAASKYEQSLTLLRRWCSRFFRLFTDHWLVTAVDDTQCGLKAFSGNIANILFAKQKVRRFAFDIEILYLAFKLRLDVKRIPVRFQGESSSTLNLMTTPWSMLKDILFLPFHFYMTRKYGTTREWQNLAVELARKKNSVENIIANQYAPIADNPMSNNFIRPQQKKKTTPPERSN